MPVKMGVDPEKTKPAKTQPDGWYKLKLVKFAPKFNANDKNSVNFNAQFEVLNSAGPEFNKTVFATMSDKMPRHICDYIHGLGLPLETNGDLPGQWNKDPKDPDNVEKFQYQGPLYGRTMECELSTTVYKGNPRNEIRQCRCAVPDCAIKFPDIRHQTDMIGKRKG